MIEAVKIEIEAGEAKRLYREYREHAHYSRPIDDEVRRAYQLLAQGKLVIRALESIVKAGVGEDGMPKLALMQATKDRVVCRMRENGVAIMTANGNFWGRPAFSHTFNFPAGSFPTRADWLDRTAFMPQIPLPIRPRHGLENYHVLWEAEWRPVAPRDPYLLRRIGKSDMWLVVAMWDLTEVERAALASRITVQ